MESGIGIRGGRAARSWAFGLILVAALTLTASQAAARGHHVLRVGTWHGVPGDFNSIQSAVDHARRGDWILIGPGDYHERGDYGHKHHAPPDGAGNAVTIDTPRLRIRGMNRNRVIVDGTRPGSAPCSSNPNRQRFGPKGESGDHVGRNGIVAYSTGVYIENLTACNFLGEGNQIWWNGGDGSGAIGMGSWWGKYLSATTTYYDADKPQATYGEFVSNASGPGRLAHSYASNMNDSGVYIGACAQECHSVVTTSHFQYNALGLSSTNAGGPFVIKRSEWDHNATGMVTNSQNNDDAPSPQDGACPNGGTGPTGTYSCWFLRRNFVHDNNDNHTPRDVPSPTGTGIVIAGGRHDTVMHNRVVHNGAWGILLVPYPDVGTPPPIAHCEGGIEQSTPGGTVCFYDDWGNQVHHNVVARNGFFGNPTNGDLAEDSLAEPSELSNCWYANRRPDGSAPSADPPGLQTLHGQSVCGQMQTTGGDDGELSAQTACDTDILETGCPPSPGMTYPQTGDVRLRKLPKQRSMPDPCQGVPANPWCSGHGGH
jgi:hypothetical protein